LAIASLLDTLRQVLGYMLFKASQQKRPQLCRKPLPGDALGRFCILTPRLVGFRELFLVPEIARLNEIRNAPEIQQAILERSAREGQSMFRFQLFYGLSDLGCGILAELRF